MAPRIAVTVSRKPMKPYPRRDPVQYGSRSGPDPSPPPSSPALELAAPTARALAAAAPAS